LPQGVQESLAEDGDDELDDEELVAKQVIMLSCQHSFFSASLVKRQLGCIVGRRGLGSRGVGLRPLPTFKQVSQRREEVM